MKTHLEELQQYYRYDAIKASRKTCEAILKDDEDNKDLHTVRRYFTMIKNIKKGIK